MLVHNLSPGDYLPTYLPIYGKPLQDYFHIWVDPRYLPTYLPTTHPDLMTTEPPDVFPWSLNVFHAFFMYFGWVGPAKRVESGPQTATPAD